MPTTREELKDQLMEVQKDLREATKVKARAARDADVISDEMKNEVIELLRVFQLPYLIAPFEAEAQCVTQTCHNLTGTVTI